MKRFSSSLFGGLSSICLFALTLFTAAPVLAQSDDVSAKLPGSPYNRAMVPAEVDNRALITTRGALSPLVRRATDNGSVSESLPMEHIQMGLLRAPEVQKAFDTYVDGLHRSGNANFHKWLTPQEIGENFGPAQSDIAKLTAWLEKQGFKVNFVSTSGMVVDFTGDAGLVRDAFHTEIHNITFPSGEKHIAAVKEAQVPQAFQSLVAGFPSMGDIHAKPMFSRKGSVQYNPTTHKVEKSFPNPDADPNFTFTCPASICGTATQELTVGATDFYTIYNETPLFSSGINGTGQTVAVIEESDINTADVTTFRTAFGVTPATPALTVAHGTPTITCNDPGKLDTSSDPEESEADIDAEWAGVVAPSATILFESCKSTSSTQGILLAAEAVVDGNLAVSASLSYGLPEAILGTSSAPTYGANSLWNNLWEQAAAQGMTVAVSSGDSGVALEDYIFGDTDPLLGLSMATTYGQTVNGLGSTPWNVSAGGTDFQDLYNYAMSGSSGGWITNYWNTATSTAAPFSSAKSYVPETIWNGTCASPIFANDLVRLGYLTSGNNNPYTSCAEAYNYAGTNGQNNLAVKLNGGSGGLSSIYSTPTWQKGVFGISTNITGGKRGMPDISLFASNGFWSHSLMFCDSDPYGGSGSATAVPCTYTNASDAIYQTAGGTSFVAPQIAGMMALVAQKTSERQGQADYVLYGMAGNEYGATSDSGVCLASGTTSNIGISSSASYLPASSCVFYDVTTGSDDQPCLAKIVNSRSGTTTYDPDCYATATDAYTSGRNTVYVGAMSTSTTTWNPTYNATVGYDLASGLGSVNIGNLVNGWIGGTYSVGYTATVSLADATLNGTSWSYGNPPASSNLVTTVTGNGSLPTGTVTDAAAPTVGTIGSGNFPATNCSTLSGTASGSGNCQSSNTVTVAYAPSATLPPNTYTVTSTYSTVNENYSTGANDTLTFTINTQALTTGTKSVTPSSLPYSVSTPVTLSEGVSWTGSGAAPVSTDFSFSLNGVSYPASCALGTKSYTCTATVSGATVAALPVAAYPVTFGFTSDGNYTGSSGLPVGTLTITTDSTSVTVTPAPTSIGPGGSSIVTIKVNNTQASATSTPAGSVSLVDTSNGNLALGGCTLSSGSCTINVPAASLKTGANTLTATYAASPANWASPTTGTGTLTLTGAPTTSISLTPATTGSTTTGVTTATLTANIVAASNDGLWGGTVTFTNTTTGATYPGTVTGSGTTGSASVTITEPDSGTAGGLNNYTATYAGTANYQGSGPSNSVAVYWQGLLISSVLPHDFSGKITYGTSPAISVEGTIDGTKLGPYGVTVYNFTTAAQTVGVNFTNSASGAFSYATNCPTSLAAGKTCNIFYYYAPPSGDGCNPYTNCTIDKSVTPNLPQGTYEAGSWRVTSSATLGVGDSGFDRSGPVAFPATLAGKAVLPTGSLISVSPLSYTFGPLAPSELSNTLTITVTNSSAASVGLAYTGPTTAAFQAKNYCPATLGGNATCTVNVTFQDGAVGTYHDTVKITPTGGTAISVALTGIVNANNGLQLSTNAHNFGNVTAGQSAGAFGLSITNHSTSSATLSFGTSQPGATPYSVVTSGCPSSLAAGAQCSVIVNFTPTTVGTFSDVLTITSSVPILPDGTTSAPYTDTVTFSGAGVAAGEFTASSAVHNWGTVPVGTAGTNYGVQLTNTTAGALTLNLGAGFTSGQNGFTLAGTNCGPTLAVNASCELIFSFTPAASGAVSASYGVSAKDTGNNPVNLYSGGTVYTGIALSGTGQ